MTNSFHRAQFSRGYMVLKKRTENRLSECNTEPRVEWKVTISSPLHGQRRSDMLNGLKRMESTLCFSIYHQWCYWQLTFRGERRFEVMEGEVWVWVVSISRRPRPSPLPAACYSCNYKFLLFRFLNLECLDHWYIEKEALIWWQSEKVMRLKF